MADRPSNPVAVLRQLASSSGKPVQAYPEWFQEDWKKDGHHIWEPILTDIADQMETMQANYGKLYKKLYPD